MSVLAIRVVPDPALRARAKKVRAFDDSLHHLIHDMLETMRRASGVGLAANQVGVLRRVIVIEIPPEEEAGQSTVYTLVNPEIVSKSGERVVTEGCLSIPGYRGEVVRSLTVQVRARDQYGKAVHIRAQGLLAHALEHEIDHLNGVLYIDHVEDPAKLSKIEQEGEQTVEAAAPAPS